MDSSSSMHGAEVKCKQISIPKRKGKRQVADVKIILKCILKTEWDGVDWIRNNGELF
jgi:hypothetical protein